MTYKEAKRVLDDNFDIVNPQMIASEPPHLVLGGIVAPEGSAIPTLGFIYEKITDEHIANDEILLNNNWFGNNLIVYVVFKMKGSFWFQPLDSYKIAPFFVTKSGNES